MMKVANRIRQLRYSKGWSPEDLAARANISRTALYQIESGKTELPRAATLRRLARALDVGPDQLIEAEPGEAAGPAGPRRGEAAPSWRAEPSGADPAAAEPQAWIHALDSEMDLERKFRILLRSPLRDAVARIVEASFLLLPAERRQ